MYEGDSRELRVELAYGASDYVGDPHQVVVHDIRKVIRREAITLDEDKVLLLLLLLIPPVDPVHERRGLPSLETHHVRLAPGGPVGGLLGGDGPAGARVARRLVARRSVLLVLLEVGGSAEAAVGVARLNKLFGMGAVYVQSLGLRDCERVSAGLVRGRRKLTCRYGPKGPPTSGPALR